MSRLSSLSRLGRQPHVRAGAAVPVVPTPALEQLDVEPSRQHRRVGVKQLAPADPVVDVSTKYVAVIEPAK